MGPVDGVHAGVCEDRTCKMRAEAKSNEGTQRYDVVDMRRSDQDEMFFMTLMFSCKSTIMMTITTR